MPGPQLGMSGDVTRTAWHSETNSVHNCIVIYNRDSLSRLSIDLILYITFFQMNWLKTWERGYINPLYFKFIHQRRCEIALTKRKGYLSIYNNLFHLSTKNILIHENFLITEISDWDHEQLLEAAYWSLFGTQKFYWNFTCEHFKRAIYCAMITNAMLVHQIEMPLPCLQRPC